MQININEKCNKSYSNYVVEKYENHADIFVKISDILLADNVKVLLQIETKLTLVLNDVQRDFLEMMNHTIVNANGKVTESMITHPYAVAHGIEELRMLTMDKIAAILGY